MRTEFNMENGESEIVCSEKELGQLGFVLGALGATIGVYLGYQVGASNMQKRWCKLMPDLINEMGFRGCEATLEAIEEMGPEARKFVRKHGNQIAGHAGHKFYSDRDIVKFIKTCKKRR